MSNFVESPEKFAGFHLQRRTSCEPFRVCVYVCVCASIVHACISLAATFPQLGMDRTVWNFQDFSVTQILREINIKDSES